MDPGSRRRCSCDVRRATLAPTAGRLRDRDGPDRRSDRRARRRRAARAIAGPRPDLDRSADDVVRGPRPLRAADAGRRTRRLGCHGHQRRGRAGTCVRYRRGLRAGAVRFAVYPHLSSGPRPSRPLRRSRRRPAVLRLHRSSDKPAWRRRVRIARVRVAVVLQFDRRADDLRRHPRRPVRVAPLGRRVESGRAGASASSCRGRAGLRVARPAGPCETDVDRVHRVVARPRCGDLDRTSAKGLGRDCRGRFRRRYDPLLVPRAPAAVVAAVLPRERDRARDRIHGRHVARRRRLGIMELLGSRRLRDVRGGAAGQDRADRDHRPFPRRRARVRHRIEVGIRATRLQTRPSPPQRWS